ncbi:hypothetical protein LGR64_12385 [Delftia sp. Lp-1]|jgi:DNA-binding transcriptional regulator YdaS (Cro superfamily)|uniref:hypothetical protein n=1 Tax=Delftia sp. Lp-1 TaxID=682863 RepID=UPI001E659705|nr:hypothetical protein [Delftia sp. Lp-1]MCB4787078.1 hypothetical protein [Delftia sp. Lp-1]
MTTFKPCDELRRYLEAQGALSITELRSRVGAKQDTQIRHWRDGVRRPKPKTAVAIEQVTLGQVPRHVWYPDEWKDIWPEYEPTPPKSLQAAETQGEPGHA